MISTRNFANPIHAKIGAATTMQEATPNVGNLLSKYVPLKWNSIFIKWIYGLIHKFSRSINVFSTMFCFISNCASNVACSAESGYSIFSSLSLLRPFTVHYWNMQSRRNQLLCATSERDYKLQHWIEMLALPRQNTIMPLSGLLHRVHRFFDFYLNIGCFAIEKRVKQKFSTWMLLPVITKYVRPIFSTVGR